MDNLIDTATPKKQKDISRPNIGTQMDHKVNKAICVKR